MLRFIVGFMGLLHSRQQAETAGTTVRGQGSPAAAAAAAAAEAGGWKSDIEEVQLYLVRAWQQKLAALISTCHI
jgi:hypothetical protein